MQTIFALSSGRSGTSFIADFLKKNIAHSKVTHEPKMEALWWPNPSMFGKPIYYNAFQQYDRIRPYLQKKQRYIAQLDKAFYFESNHALVKSAHTLLHDYFPDCKFLHAIRNPIEVAKSEANRESHIMGYNTRPFYSPENLRFFYKGDDGKKYFIFALTGYEEIYKPLDVSKLSEFEFYVIQWIEIENRIMAMLDKNQKHQDCYTIHTPQSLNDYATLDELVNFFGFIPSKEKFNLRAKKNKTPGKETIISKEDKQAFVRVVSKISPTYLEIFSKAPYQNQPWVDQLFS